MIGVHATSPFGKRLGNHLLLLDRRIFRLKTLAAKPISKRGAWYGPACWVNNEPVKVSIAFPPVSR